MFGFGVIALHRWQESGYLFFLLLAVREFVAAYFFLVRKKAVVASSFRSSLLAWGSSILPLCYVGSSGHSTPTTYFIFEALAIVGFGLAALATLDLGSSLGVSPARRSVVKTGVYRWLKHPMYLGYVISECGWLIVSPWNWPIFVVSVTCYLLRVRAENIVVSSHEQWNAG